MKKAFSLIELLIVIAIIGILAGAIIFTLGDPSTEARVGVLTADLSNVPSAALTHSVKNPTTGFKYVCDDFTADIPEHTVDGAAASGPLKSLSDKYTGSAGSAFYTAACSSNQKTWAVAAIEIPATTAGDQTPVLANAGVRAWCLSWATPNVVDGFVTWSTAATGAEIAAAIAKDGTCATLGPDSANATTITTS